MYPLKYSEREFITQALEDQFKERYISPDRHRILITLVDQNLLGMDGFRYCPLEEARENWRRCHP